MARTITETPTGVEGGCGSHPGKKGTPGPEIPKEITLSMLAEYASHNGWIDYSKEYGLTLFDHETNQFVGDSAVVSAITQFSADYFKRFGEMIDLYAEKRGITHEEVIDEIATYSHSN